MQCLPVLGSLALLGLLTPMHSAAAEPVPLPLDAIGLYVTQAKTVRGGSGYRPNDSLALPGGATVVVSTTSLEGAVQDVAVTQPVMHACLPKGAVPAQGTSGGGTGAAFSLSVLAATGYATRRLTQCYAGPALTVHSPGSSTGLPIGFLPDGSLDTPALDRFAAGDLTPRVSIWNDQGGGQNDATQGVPSERPLVSAGRLHGNTRAVVFDAHGGAGEWDPAATFLSLPPAVAINANRFTLAIIAEATSAYMPVGFITLGPATGKHAGLAFGRDDARPTACEGAGDTAYAAMVPTETPAVMLCTADAQGKTVDMQGTSTTTPGGNGAALRGGTLGQSADERSGLVNLSAAIVVPWPLDAATRGALERSLYQTFGLAPQAGGVIVVLGDSHSDGTGARFQQGWTHQMMQRLGRQDIQLVNAARYGGQLSDAVAQWRTYAQPNLAAASGPVKIVILQGGYNDQQSGQTVDEILATFQRGAALAHAAGAKAVCVADVLRNASSLTNRVMARVNAAIRAPLQGCDAVIDWASEPAYNLPAGPYRPPYFAQDRVHLTTEGQAVQAQIAASVVAGLLR